MVFFLICKVINVYAQFAFVEFASLNIFKVATKKAFLIHFVFFNFFETKTKP